MKASPPETGEGRSGLGQGPQCPGASPLCRRSVSKSALLTAFPRPVHRLDGEVHDQGATAVASGSSPVPTQNPLFPLLLSSDGVS